MTTLLLAPPSLAVFDLNGGVSAEFCAESWVIYALTDTTEPGVVRYVGQSRRPLIRLAEHICGDVNTTCREWVAELVSMGRLPVMSILAVTNAWSANADEAAWIDRMRRDGHPLSNRRGADHRMTRPVSEVLADIPASNDLIAPAKVATILGVTTHALACMTARGDAPRRIRIGTRTYRYRPQDVRAWVEATP